MTEPLPKIQRRVQVTGRVQGVGYRASTQRAAQVHPDLSGWVENQSDGSVIAVFQGPADQVEAMVEWCSHGPAGATVEQIQISNETLDQSLLSFELRY